MKTEYIYVLHADDGRPFYCGHSIRPDARLQEHVDEATHGGRSLKCQHIRFLLSQGQTVRMRIVDECPADELGDLEAWWVDQLAFSGLGLLLYNGNSGRRGAQQDEVQERRNSQEIRRSLKAQKRKAVVDKYMSKLPQKPAMSREETDALTEQLLNRMKTECVGSDPPSVKRWLDEARRAHEELR